MEDEERTCIGLEASRTSKEKSDVLIQVSRPALTIACRSTLYGHCQDSKPSVLRRVSRRAKECCRCSKACVWRVLKARLPILDWLFNYSLRNSLLGDVIAGLTVGVMHIPQGMGFALLAALPTINGLYMSFFPPLIYIFVGASRHISMGTFAVSCMMMQKTVVELSTETHPVETQATMIPAHNGSSIFNDSMDGFPNAITATHYSPQEVATAIALTVGIIEMVMGALRIGQIFSVLLSATIISGFTTSVAFHVITSQLKNLLGIRIARYSGPFKAIYTYRDVCLSLPDANPVVVAMTIVCFVIMCLNNHLLKPRLRKVSRIPIPIELLVIGLGAAVSHLLSLSQEHNVTVVGHIPSGLPAPSSPPVTLLPKVLMESCLIAFISYTTSLSMARIFAQRHKYTVDATQELYAQGVSNVFGAFFGCGAVASSVSRSMIQDDVGGNTQLASFFSCTFVLLCLSVMGPLFHSLPQCVLSTIIVISLKGLFLQVKEPVRLWSSSRVDAVVWLVTFLVSVVVDLDYGLLAGVITSVMTLFLRTQRPHAIHLGHVPLTDLYLDLNKYTKAVEVPGVKIFQFGGPLHFGNVSYFHSKLFSVTGLRLRTAAKHPTSDKLVHANTKEPRWLVVDMSLVSFVDTSGAKLLTQIHHDLQTAGVTLCLTSLSDGVVNSLEKCGVLDIISREHIFHSTHDAVSTITTRKESQEL